MKTTVIFLSLSALVLSMWILSIVGSMDSAAMIKCEEKHSRAVCQHTLSN